MRWGGDLGLSWWVLNTITSTLIRGRLDYKEEGKGNVTTETKVQTVDFEDGGRGREPRKAECNSRNWKKQGNRFFLRAFRGHEPC